MQTAESRLFTARLAALPEVLGYLRTTCQNATLPRAMVLRVELIIEELFTNTVRHGYRADSDAPVWLQIVTAPGSLVLIYQDAAPAFDPLQYVAELPAPVGALAVGGLGIHLVRELASSVTYRRAEGRNILTLTFQTPGMLRRQSPRT